MACVMLQHLVQQMLLPLLTALLFLHLPGAVVTQQIGNSSSYQVILFPSQGDLLIGRVPHLTASSTCGEVTPKVYCPIGYTKCFTCDSKHEWDKDLNPNSHKIGNVVAKIRNANTTYDSWWMSEPGAENVTIQLDLDAKFTFTHLIMIFHSYRPKSWWLERSSDYGDTYKPYGYFAEKCEEVFPWVRTGPRMQLNDVVCSSSYTDMTPSDKGQVVFNAIPQHISDAEVIGSADPAARMRRQFQTDITNLRIHLVKYHTLSDEKLSSDSSELSKYYFGLYEMNVHGMCICNGHAMTCKPADGMSVIDRNAVYGHCECMHNTQGPNCEECRDFYHDRKWAPATLQSSNECRRCQCHGHSNKCAFSQKKWDETGGLRGGVCLDCLHNTTGDNCQRCAQGYYRDEAKLLEDPDICAPCECSNIGIREAFCEPETDKAKGLIAGHCHCKENVAGRKCDRCKPGYWNLRRDNSAGCQVCDCWLMGTTGNQGCDQYTGQCPCKPNVEGEKCNRCKPGFFNLSLIDIGCSACECDIGGSLSSICNLETGACVCKPGFEGRKCEIVSDRYYVPHFDIDGSVVDITESPDSSRFPTVTKPEEPTLTGRSGIGLRSPTQRTPDELVIPLRNRTVGLPTGEYDIALKVYPRRVNRSVELLLQLDAGPSTTNCSMRPSVLDGSLRVPTTADFRAQQAASGGRPYLVQSILRKVCIDAIGLDKIRILLFAVPSTEDIVIDAVIIGKALDDPIKYQLNKTASTGRSILPPFNIDATASMVTSLYNCLDYWKPAEQQLSHMPDECRRLIQSLSGRSLSGASRCSCDGYGSRSPVCEKIGGQCPCWPNVVGRTCNLCAPRHYGLGRFLNEGCRPCGCSPEGSTSDQCDREIGQCSCLHPNIAGKQCNSCKTGYWNFPICLECQCHGLAVDCHKATGGCLNCGNNTTGSECQDCATGYYGDPRRRISCRPCPCPGGLGGSVQHALTCQLKSDWPPTAKCNCKPGYLGDSCERCDVNYYGDPAVGDCTRCSCNGNINFSVPNSCDPHTGRCVKCLHQTTGASCEECRSGFYGQAAAGRCQPCQCNAEGTVPDARLATPLVHAGWAVEFTCERKSGQCDCLLNVEGRNCDQCKPLHYNLSSRTGCSACDCDPIGSFGAQCALATGQCNCRPGRGGRRCDQCQDLHFGDPTKPGLEGCRPCACHPKGSVTNRCDKITGRCVCKSAITGRQCDQCERGTTGVLPNCTTCGECWYNWDKIITGLASTGSALQDRAELTAQKGNFPGDLGTSVEQTESVLDEIWRAINETRVPGQMAVDVQRKLDNLVHQYDVAKNVTQRRDSLLAQLDIIKSVNLRAMNGEVDRLNQDHLRLKRRIEAIEKEGSDPNLQAPSRLLNQIKDQSELFKISSLQLGEANKTVAREGLLSAQNSARMNYIEDHVTKLKEAVKNRSEAAAAIYQRVETMLPELNKEMCVGYDGDASLYSRSKNYCSDMCGGPSPSLCNATTSQCARATVCSKSVVAEMQAVEANLVSLDGRTARHLETAVNRTLDLTAMSVNASLVNDSATSTGNQVQKLMADYLELKKLAEELGTNIEDFLRANRSTVSGIRNLSEKLQKASSTFSSDSLTALSDLVRSLLRKLQNEQEVSLGLAATKVQRQAVKDLLKKAEDVVNKTEVLRSRAESLTKQLSQDENRTRASTALLDMVQNAIEELNDIIQMNVSSALRDYNKAVGFVRSKGEQIEDRLRKLMETNLKSEIKGLEREQNETMKVQLETQKVLERLEAQTESSRVTSRQQTIDRLKQKLKDVSNRLGGSRGIPSTLEETVKAMEDALERDVTRLRKLLDTLRGESDVKGSLANMMHTVYGQQCFKKES